MTDEEQQQQQQQQQQQHTRMSSLEPLERDRCATESANGLARWVPVMTSTIVRRYAISATLVGTERDTK